MTAGSALPYALAAYTFTTVLGAASGATVPLAGLWLLVIVWLHEPPHFYGPCVQDSAACAMNFLCWFAVALFATCWMRVPALQRSVRPAAWVAGLGLPFAAWLGPPLVLSEWT
jgi:hypothetical protein